MEVRSAHRAGSGEGLTFPCRTRGREGCPCAPAASPPGWGPGSGTCTPGRTAPQSRAVGTGDGSTESSYDQTRSHQTNELFANNSNEERRHVIPD